MPVDPIPVALPIVAIAALGVGVFLYRRGPRGGIGVLLLGIAGLLVFVYVYFVPVWRLALAARTPAEQYAVARAYFTRGSYNYPNVAAGTRWLEKAAAGGHARAQYELGLAYLHGWGVSQDEKTAYTWFQKAHANGNRLAESEIDRLAIRYGRPAVAPAN